MGDAGLRPGRALGVGRRRRAADAGRPGFRRGHRRAHHGRLRRAGLRPNHRRPQGVRQRRSFEPHNIPFSLLGAGLLWVGWFGFNGGSSLAANGLAVQALVNTNTAAAAAALSWMFLTWKDGKPSILGIITGAVVGCVAITPAAGFVTPMAALVIGAVAAPISYYAIRMRQRSRLDESLDVWACHGMGGVWGALATGLFATKAINPAGFDGLFYGNPSQLLIQAVAVVAAGGFSFVVTYVLAKVVNATVGLRVSEREEEVGLDISEHAERAYA